LSDAAREIDRLRRLRRFQAVVVRRFRGGHGAGALVDLPGDRRARAAAVARGVEGVSARP
jgi:hypothetical protein